MPVFSGSPSSFINRVLAGMIEAVGVSSVGASSTTFTARTASHPKVAVAVGDGNSLTLDYFDALRTLLIASQASHPGQVWHVINSGLGSTQTPTMTASFAADVTRYYNPHAICLLHFCELTNHIQSGGATAQVAIDAAVAYCVQARAAGWRLVFHIPTPRASTTDSGMGSSLSAWNTAAKLTAYNTACDYFRAHPEHYDYLIDLPVTPGLANPLDATYYSTDGVHLTAAGIALKAQVVHDAQLGFVL